MTTPDNASLLALLRTVLDLTDTELQVPKHVWRRPAPTQYVGN